MLEPDFALFKDYLSSHFNHLNTTTTGLTAALSSTPHQNNVTPPFVHWNQDRGDLEPCGAPSARFAAVSELRRQTFPNGCIKQGIHLRFIQPCKLDRNAQGTDIPCDRVATALSPRYTYSLIVDIGVFSHSSLPSRPYTKYVMTPDLVIFTRRPAPS